MSALALLSIPAVVGFAFGFAAGAVVTVLILIVVGQWLVRWPR